MKEIIAMHGWGGDHQIWAPWEAYFKTKGWIWQNANRGYGDHKPNHPSWINSSLQESTNQKVLICHSLGSHLIRKQILKQATDIVLINSFSSFIPNKKEKRLLTTALLGMKKALGTSMEKNMLKTFLIKSCHPHSVKKFPPSPLTEGLSSSGRRTLQKDLEVLISSCGLPSGFPQNAKVLQIAGKEDSIVSPSANSLLSKDLQNYLENEPTTWTISNEGHYSLMNPEAIKYVKDWIEASK